MWLLSQVQVDPSTAILAGSGPYVAVVGVLLLVCAGLSRWAIVQEREKRRMAEQVMSLTREVLPVLTEVTSELRRLIDHRERER